MHLAAVVASTNPGFWVPRKPPKISDMEPVIDGYARAIAMSIDAGANLMSEYFEDPLGTIDPTPYQWWSKSVKIMLGIKPRPWR